MNVDEFDFDLPEELIAQKPLKKREASRLLILNGKTKERTHTEFPEIINYLKAGDTLVLNNTRVLPARLIGEKEDTQAKIELLLLHESEADIWEVLLKPAKKVHPGTVISFGDGKLRAECLEKLPEGRARVELIYDGILLEILSELGEMPLPPYIKEKLEDEERYQTVYAKETGSAAAPTAGLHFTKDILNKIKNKGVNICYVTLHVGLGTFRPVNVSSVEAHEMHAEYYEISEETAGILNQAKKTGNRIISVGTTSTRVLETNYQEFNQFKASQGWTNIFIYPPYQYQAIDGLLTNFHLPKSTLLMLISALVDQETILDVYKEAVKERYRFFSFGDAMFITKGD